MLTSGEGIKNRRKQAESVSCSQMHYSLQGCPPNSQNTANPLDECSICRAVNENCIASKQERQRLLQMQIK